MNSPSRPLPDPSRLGIVFWLPPGGVDNGVWASADADVGGYVGSPGGGIKRPGRRVIHRCGWIRCNTTAPRTC